MIKDTLTNADTYFGLSEKLQKGFEWLQKTDLEAITDGKYLISSEEIFANVQSYETKDNAPYEAHRKYIDIQYMIKGEERVGVISYNHCTVKEEYDKDKDLEFLNYSGIEEFHTLKTGEFLVFYPQDAHKPSLDSYKKHFVKKVIVKVAL